MCGIVASLNDRKWVDKNNLNHRGPDNTKTTIVDNLTVKFHRLHIIGDPTIQQPFSDKDNNFLVWCNGEVLNYLELMQEYGISNKSGCDIEILPKLFNIIGIKKTLSKIRGFFSILIYDKINSKIYSAVDHFGVKPMYFKIENKKIFFSSELRLFDKTNLSKIGIKQYFETMSTISPNTLIDKVYSLSPSQILCFDTTDPENYYSEIYWSINIQSIGKKNISYDDIVKNFERSISRNLIADHPICNLLSGGIDSTLLALYSSDGIKENLFFDYENLKKDNFEKQNIDNLKKQIKICELKIDKNNFLENFDEFIESSDEITYDFASYTYFLLMKNVKKLGHRVILNGTGGDELFYGYERYSSTTYVKNLFGFLVNKQPLNNSYDFLKKGFWNRSKFEGKIKISPKKKDFENKLEYLRFIDFSYYLNNTLLKYTDRISSFFQIESRVPFLDVDFVESVFYSKNLSRKIKSKFDLKKMMKKFKIYNELSFQKKEGLGLPIEKIISSKDLKNIILPRIIQSDIYNSYLKTIDILNFNFKNRIHIWRIMAIYSLVVWYEK